MLALKHAASAYEQLMRLPTLNCQPEREEAQWVGNT